MRLLNIVLSRRSHFEEQKNIASKNPRNTIFSNEFVVKYERKVSSKRMGDWTLKNSQRFSRFGADGERQAASLFRQRGFVQVPNLVIERAKYLQEEHSNIHAAGLIFRTRDGLRMSRAGR